MAGSEPPTLAVVGTGEVRAPAGEVVGVAPLTVGPAVGVVTVVAPEGPVPESSLLRSMPGTEIPTVPSASCATCCIGWGSAPCVAAIAVPVEAASVTTTRADAASERRRRRGALATWCAVTNAAAAAAEPSSSPALGGPEASARSRASGR